MDTTRTNAIASTWLMSFGHSEPPPDSRRIAGTSPQIKKPRKPRVIDKSKMLVRSRAGTRLRRGIFALLRKGIDDQVQVYDLLFYRGSIQPHVPGKRGSGMSKNEFLKYLYQSRVKLGIPRKNIKTQVICLHQEGKGESEISKELKTRQTYVRKILIEIGMLEKKPRKVRKHTQPAWSKQGISN